MSATRIKEELWARYEIRLGATEINDMRKFLKFEFRPPKYIQQLTVDQKQWRLWFAQEMMNNTWEVANVIFSDESRFVLDGDKGNVWRRRGEDNESATTEYQKVPKIIAAIGPGFKSKLVIIKGTENTERYREMLLISDVFGLANRKFGAGNYFLCRMVLLRIQRKKI
jgi:hypothetical protein